MDKISPSNQTNDEWLADYDGIVQISKPNQSLVINLHPKTRSDELKDRVKRAGIISIRNIVGGLLINADKPITKKLNKRILCNLNQLASIAEPDTGESLYIYSGYRTFMSNRKACIAITFNNIQTKEIAERYFNIELRKGNGGSFKTGNNCDFRIKGNIKRPVKGSFIKFWLDTTKQIPDDRPSHISRYMNTKLSGVIVSCSNSKPHHQITKLIDIKYEGCFYKFP